MQLIAVNSVFSGAHSAASVQCLCTTKCSSPQVTQIKKISLILSQINVVEIQCLPL